MPAIKKISVLFIYGLVMWSQSHGVLLAAAPADHVFLISIDGLRPEFYLDTHWPAPTLQRLANEGGFARRVKPVFPTVTYPNHTTIVTGAYPGRHGIYYNSPFEPGGDAGRWYWEAAAIKVPTLWDVVNAHGVTASVGWPVTVGASIDFNIPEYWTPGRFDDFAEPVRQVTRPLGLLAQIETAMSGRWTDRRIANDHPRRDLLTAAAAAWLVQEKQPRLLLWHAIAVDHFQHDEGRDGQGVREALAAVDAGIGLLMDYAAKAGILERTAIIVTGDHGFYDVRTRLAPNVLLKQAGLLDDHRQRRDWRAAFLVTGAAAFLHLRDEGDEQTVAEVIAALNQLPSAERELFDILMPSELKALNTAPDAALALAPKAGVTLSADSQGEWRRAASGGQHGHRVDGPEMYTGMVVWGAGVRAGAVIEQINLTDIAPLASALLGVPFVAPDGVLHDILIQ